MVKYNDLSRKEKQLIANQYPYKKDQDLYSNASFPVLKKRSELDEFKKEAEQEGVTIMKQKNFVSTSSGVTSLIDMALGEMGEDSYRAALELAKVEFDPIEVLKQLFTIETTRLRKGIEYEEELGLGLNQDTQAAMNSLVNIAKNVHDMEEGQKYSLEFRNSLSGMIMDMDLDQDEDVIDIIDIDPE